MAEYLACCRRFSGSARKPAVREPWQVVGAWAVSVATAPVGLLLMFGVDRIAAALQWSPFAS